jgi:hypothetical protein
MMPLAEIIALPRCTACGVVTSPGESCRECTPSPCARCGAQATRRDGCGQCARAERWEAKARALHIPERFAWSSFAAEGLLASRVGAGKVAVDTARRSVDAATLVFVGPTGAGKTSLASATLRARFALDFDRRDRRSYAHRFVSAPAVAGSRATHPLGRGDAPAVVAAVAVDLLLLDDVGSEASRYSEVIAEIIHTRHDASRATWVTTGLTTSQIAERYSGAIERRIYEHATIIRCASGGAR